jgi:hypothetical protein
MSILGHVKNGVVILDAGSSLPDGTAVRVEPVERPDQPADLQAQLLEWAGKEVDLPADLARRHDHYLHPGQTHQNLPRIAESTLGCVNWRKSLCFLSLSRRPPAAALGRPLGLRDQIAAVSYVLAEVRHCTVVGSPGKVAAERIIRIPAAGSGDFDAFALLSRPVIGRPGRCPSRRYAALSYHAPQPLSDDDERRDDVKVWLDSCVCQLAQHFENQRSLFLAPLVFLGSFNV